MVGYKNLFHFRHAGRVLVPTPAKPNRTGSTRGHAGVLYSVVDKVLGQAASPDCFSRSNVGTCPAVLVCPNANVADMVREVALVS